MTWQQERGGNPGNPTVQTLLSSTMSLLGDLSNKLNDLTAKIGMHQPKCMANNPGDDNHADTQSHGLDGSPMRVTAYNQVKLTRDKLQTALNALNGAVPGASPFGIDHGGGGGAGPG